MTEPKSVTVEQFEIRVPGHHPMTVEGVEALGRFRETIGSGPFEIRRREVTVTESGWESYTVGES